MSKVRRAGGGRAVRRDPLAGMPSGRPSQLILPLTDRILAVFPGPRWIWIVFWSLLGIPLTYLLLRVIQSIEPSSEALAGGQPGLWQSAAIVNAILFSLWGAHRLAGDLERTGPAISRLTLDEGPNADPLPVFSGEPRFVALTAATAAEAAEAAYRSLGPGPSGKDFRVAVAGILATPGQPDKADIHIINRHEGT